MVSQLSDEVQGRIRGLLDKGVEERVAEMLIEYAVRRLELAKLSYGLQLVMGDLADRYAARWAIGADELDANLIAVLDEYFASIYERINRALHKVEVKECDRLEGRL